MSENVQVAVRMRPFNDREKAMESTCCIRMVKDTQQTIITDPETNVDKVFTFDYSYNSFAPADDPEHASQDTVWDDIGVKVLEHAWNGFNVSLFAYGQTGSGKSFSMVGYGSDKGIIPRASEVIFQRIDATTSGVVFKVEASMMEIYNEHVKDLFNPSSDNLKIRDHPRQGPYAEGLTRHAVSSYQEISRLMDAGILARTTASTNMNATSSRAHTIFQIVVTQSEMNESTNKVMDKVSRINLIDLAGSERAASTGATGTRLKEGAAINQSLSALGNCISALADIANGKKKILVPYRNSKLTHLLKDSLGGNSKTIMIAALSPASVNFSETLSTLRYADRAKQIKNQAIVNEDPNQLLIRQLKEEVEALRKAMLENNIDPSRPQSRGGYSEGADGEGMALHRERDPEKEKEIAAIREQLEEHQRLLKESEKSWQDRLQETEELARKREEQLKTLGLATNTAELRAKSMAEAHLLNLNEDQVMSEKLVYFLQHGINKVGRVDAAEEQNIVIGGLGVLREHCVITMKTESETVVELAEDGFETSTLVETELLSIRGVNTAKISVNGVYLKGYEEMVLMHCDRLILGNSNVFRVVIPKSRPPDRTLDDIAKESHFDWQMAMKELNSNQIRAHLEIEAQAEKEKQEMDARVKQMEELMRSEHEAAEEKLRRQKEEWDVHVRQLTEAMQLKEIEIQNQMMTEGEQEKRRLAEQLAQQETKLAEELVKAEMSFEKKQEELVRKQRELEKSLQKQMREAKLLGQQKERERLERLRFDDQLLHSIPLVDEANTIAEELQNGTTFAIKLITIGPSPPALSHRSSSQEDDEIVIGCDISADLKVQVTFQEAGTYRSVMWDIDQFHANIYAMREIYQVFIENNRVVDPALWKHIEPDPFCDLPQPQLIGKTFVFINNLYYGCKVVEAAPILDHRGAHSGYLKCEVSSSVLSVEWQAQQHRLVETCPEDLRNLQLPTLDDFLTFNVRITFLVDSLRGIPGKLCKDAFVKINWPHGEAQYDSPPATSASVDPKIDFAAVIESSITPAFIAHIQTHPVEVEVYGMVPSNNLNKIASRALNVAPVEGEETESSSVAFIDVDAAKRHEALTKKKSMRRRNRKDKVSEEDDTATQLEQIKEQLSVQEKTLAENTQELENKTHEVEQLQSELNVTHHERDRLREALEEMARTNKLLQAKLEQQILKESVTKLLTDRRKTAVGKPGTEMLQSTSVNPPTKPPQIAPSSLQPKPADVNALIKAAIFEDADDSQAAPRPNEPAPPKDIPLVLPTQKAVFDPSTLTMLSNAAARKPAPQAPQPSSAQAPTSPTDPPPKPKDPDVSVSSKSSNIAQVKPPKAGCDVM